MKSWYTTTLCHDQSYNLLVTTLGTLSAAYKFHTRHNIIQYRAPTIYILQHIHVHVHCIHGLYNSVCSEIAHSWMFAMLGTHAYENRL